MQEKCVHQALSFSWLVLLAISTSSSYWWHICHSHQYGYHSQWCTTDIENSGYIRKMDVAGTSVPLYTIMSLNLMNLFILGWTMVLHAIKVYWYWTDMQLNRDCSMLSHLRLWTIQHYCFRAMRCVSLCAYCVCRLHKSHNYHVCSLSVSKFSVALCVPEGFRDGRRWHVLSVHGPC